MKNLLAAALLTVFGLMTTPAAFAQSSAPDFPSNNQPAAPKTPVAPRGSVASTREQNRAQMSPEEAQRDRQMEVLEARTGNTSFGRGNAPERQLETKGAFMVRKFQARPGSGRQEKGLGQAAGGVVTHGKPLVHNHGKKRFLLF